MTDTARTIRVESGKTVILVGPASFELLDGNATVLGAPLDRSVNVVPRAKQTPIEIHSPTSLRIRLGNGGREEEVDGSTIPLSWREAASAVTQLEEGTVVVVGGPDTGKTTLCLFLVNALAAAAKPAALVDADIGQTDLGPPSTMAAADATSPVTSLSRLEPSERIFIGCTSPGRVKGKVIQSVSRLVNLHAKPETVVIVNTDGWVVGVEAASYKIQLLDALQPAVILGIGGGDDLSAILHAAKRVTLLLASPDLIMERTRVDRRELRTLGYQKYLAGSSVRSCRLNGTQLWHLLSDGPLNLPSMSPHQLRALEESVVGFLDANDFLTEIGVLKKIVPSEMTAKILCRTSDAAKKIEIGEVRLSSTFRELAYPGEKRTSGKEAAHAGARTTNCHE
jgi:polynucleotide 5'-hydroxyl-kinase GRC3/NOL9